MVARRRDRLLRRGDPRGAVQFAVLYFYCRRLNDFDEPLDGIVYGVTASLGFATLENILYVVDGGFEVALVRAFTQCRAMPCSA